LRQIKTGRSNKRRKARRRSCTDISKASLSSSVASMASSWVGTASNASRSGMTQSSIAIVDARCPSAAEEECGGWDDDGRTARRTAVAERYPPTMAAARMLPPAMAPPRDRQTNPAHRMEGSGFLSGLEGLFCRC
jgi:hypothetical protein